MDEEYGVRRRSYVNWSQFAFEKQTERQHIIEIKHELIDSDDGYDVFRKLSHKVAGCRYDVPFGHNLLVAYARMPNGIETPVGVISFWIAGKSHSFSINQDKDFMDDYFHKISFIFVDKSYQRKRVGSVCQGGIENY